MEKMSLTAVARQLAERAETSKSGRSARTVYGGHEHILRQTVIAMTVGQKLDEHENPGEVTVFVLGGRVRLSTADNAWKGLRAIC